MPTLGRAEEAEVLLPLPLGPKASQVRNREDYNILAKLQPGGRGGWWRKGLVAAELALCVMVLIAAGLLVRSFARVQNVSPGFNPANVLTLELTLTGREYADAGRVYETYRDLWNRIGNVTGVTARGGCDVPASEPDDGVGADHGRRAAVGGW
ncbi:hypothetical protein BH18ACI5_BH18ACI5_08000 [soil metagenome]